MPYEFCTYDPASGACPKCRKKLPSAGHIRNCNPPMLGDRAAAMMRRIGISKKRWIRLTGHYRFVGGMATAQLVKVPPEERECGCGQREKILNRLHAWLNGLWRSTKS